MIVRSDLPHGVQVAQTIHAAGESVDRPIPEGTYAVALAVPNETTLRFISAGLLTHDIPHRLIVESDGEFAGQAMAIGIFPTRDKAKVGRVTSSLPLVGKVVR